MNNVLEGRICPSFCEKMKENCIFFGKYFAVSKKSSTFAPLFRRRVVRRGKKYKTRLFSSVGQST